MLKDILLAVLVLGGLGLVFGVLLGIAAKRFEVEQDDDALLAELMACLPGVNCGACGYVGCEDFARELSKGHVLPNGCIVCKQDKRDQISQMLSGGDRR